MSAVIQVVLTNYYANALQLPKELDGALVAIGGTKTLRVNKSKLMQDDQNVLRPFVAALNNLVKSSQGYVEAEDTGVVSAGAGVYNLVSAKKQIIPGTLVVTIIDNAGDPIVLKDDGAGALDEQGGTGTGTINYITGAIVVNNNLTSGTPGTGDAILIDYWKQEVGVAVTSYPLVNGAFGVPKSNLEDLIDGLGAKAEAGLRSGQAVLAAAASVAVVLDPPAPNATYGVLMTPEFAPNLEEVPHVTAKTAAGFTITFSSAQTGTVNWAVLQ